MRLGLTLCLLVSFLPTPALHGQDAEPIKVQFVSFPKGTNYEPVELLTAEGETIKVELPTNNLSPTYKVPPVQKWTLGETVVNPEPKKNEPPVTFQVYGETKALSAKEQVILVLRKGPNFSDGVDIIPFPADQRGFSGGTFLFFNGSDVDIAADVGDKSFELEKLKHVLIAPKPSKEENGRKYLYTYLYFLVDFKKKPFYASTWRLSDGARSLIFLYNDPHTGQVRTRTIRSYLTTN